MDYGRVVGQGTHQELPAGNSHYTRLCTARAARLAGLFGVLEAGI